MGTITCKWDFSRGFTIADLRIFDGTNGKKKTYNIISKFNGIVGVTGVYIVVGPKLRFTLPQMGILMINQCILGHHSFGQIM